MAESDCFSNSRRLFSNPDFNHMPYSDFAQPLNKPVYKVNAEIADKHTAGRIANKFDECGVLGFVGESWYCFSHKEATKHHALTALAKHLRLLPEQIAAFGDDYNDVGMLGLCGMGVAMQNAVPEAKAPQNMKPSATMRTERLFLFKSRYSKHKQSPDRTN